MACKGGRNFLKDLRSLYVNIGESTNEQASISSVCASKLDVLLTPNEGPYAHAMFTLEISASQDYPRTPPYIRLLTPIFHPNICAYGGQICMSMLDDWNSCYSLLDLIKAVLFLLANPNFDSANNSFGSLSPEYRDRFDEMCKQFLAGFPIKGEVYPANEKWCEWARANNCFPVPKRGQSGDEPQPPTHLTSDITPPDVLPTPLDGQFKNKVETELSELDLTPDHSSFSTPSTYVPSVAHVRYSIGTDSTPFGSIYRSCGSQPLQTLRILLHQQKNHRPRIFYFIDFLGCPSCQNREPVYILPQDDLDTPDKTSCFIDWTFCPRYFYTGERYSSYSYTPSLSCVSTLFREEEVATNAYELFPGCGNYVLCALFAESRSKLRQLEDDPLDGSVTLEDFFKLSCEIDCAHPVDGHQSVVGAEGRENEQTEENFEENGFISSEPLSSCTSGQINREERAEGEEEKEEEDSDADASESRRASENSINYLYARPNNSNYRSVSPCRACGSYYQRAVWNMQELTPSKWVFFQTRWPPILAPQQVIDLEMNYPAHIPSWRGSTPRLVKDVVIFCRQHPKLDCLVLLDPLALSLWSPVLNALCPLPVDPSSPSPHHLFTATTCSQRWTSLLWLTAADASSNRLTWPQHPLGSQGSRWVHAVARLALFSNWLAWFSRLEIATVLGQSRRSDHILCEGVATSCLHPASLGCGQAPLFAVWPLWLARLILRSSCGLFVRLCAPAGTTIRAYFPLSDTDEI